MFPTGSSISLRTAALLVVACAAGVARGAAQRAHSGYGLREVRDQGSAGINLVLGAPQGEFGQRVNVAGGVDVFVAPALGRGSPLGLRLEGSYLIYGSEHRLVSQPYYPLAINTTYSIATMGIGPQLTFGGGGPVRLYGFGTFGASYIWAHSSYDVGGCGCDPVASGIDLDDWTTALQGGGGLLITLSRRHTPVSLDVGARYLANGTAWYATPGDVVVQPNGDVVVYATRSRADLVLIHFGVSIGLR
jgi:hypothetical protein